MPKMTQHEKNIYHKRQETRRSEERLFFELIRMTGEHPRTLIPHLNIPIKRAWYLLGKWGEQGLYHYGVNLDLGWIEERIEDRHAKIGEEICFKHEADEKTKNRWIVINLGKNPGDVIIYDSNTPIPATHYRVVTTKNWDQPTIRKGRQS